MDYDQVTRHFEKACRNLQDPSSRQNAEQVILEFKSSAKAIQAGQYILEKSQEPLALFHASLAIKDAVLRDYTLMSKNDILNLQAWLINYCIQSPKLQKVIFNQILQVASIIVKRSYVAVFDNNDRQNVLNSLVQLIGVGETERYVGTLYALALVDEFSSSKASVLNLTWNFHSKAKEAFEQDLLKPIFNIILEILKNVISHYNPQTGPTTPVPFPNNDKLLEEAITVAERILSWDFSSGSRPLSGNFTETEDDTLFTAMTRPTLFPDTWSDILLREDVLHLFFAMYVTVQDGSTEQAHRTRQCLIQLAGLNHTIFKNDIEKQQRYLSIVTHGLVNLMQDLLTNPLDDNKQDEHGPNMLAVSLMVRRIIESTSLELFMSIPHCFSFLEEVAKLTSTCLKDSVAENDGLFGDISWSEEAADDLMAVWVKLANDILYEEQQGHASADFFKQYLASESYRIVEVFVEAKLEKAKAMLDEEEIEMEVEYKDWEMYNDQLLNVSILARTEPQKTIQLITNMLHDRFERVKEYDTYDPQTRNVSEQYIDFINEHIHWLVLISAYVLADEGKGEKPLVCDAIMTLSNSSSGNDPVVQLANLIFEILNHVSKAPNSVEASNVSPRVAETLFYFVERWSQTYLLIDSQDYRNCSPSLLKAFSKQGDGSRIVQFIVEKIHQNFNFWTADPDVLMTIVNVLNSFGKAPCLRSGLLESAQFPHLVTYLIDNLNTFPAHIHSALIQAITIILSGAESGVFLDMLTKTIETRILDIIQAPNFVQSCQNGIVSGSVIGSIEMFDGLVRGVQPRTNEFIFDFVNRFFDTFIKLTEVYRTRAEVIMFILQFFNSMSKYLDFSVLPTEKTRIFHDIVAKELKMYQLISISTADDDEPHRDITLILEMLDNLIVSEFESLDKNSFVQASEVVFFGVNTLMPQINLRMLELPNISIPYVRLIAHLVEFYPDKLIHVPKELFDNIIASLDWAAHSPVYEAATTTYQAITPLALYYHNERKKGKLDLVIHLDSSLQKFLSSLLDTLLFQDFDVLLIDPAAETLVSLIVAQRQYYKTLVDHLLSHPQAAQSSETHQVLVRAFERLTNAIPNDLPDVILQARDVVGFRDVVYGFLLDTRAVLRRK